MALPTTKSQPGPKSVGRLILLLLCIGGISALTVFLIVQASSSLKEGNTFRAEIVLPLIVITGVVALLATLAIAAATFGLFDMSDKSQALGLPAGSVQAVIALSLILIFAVVALYIRSESGRETFESTGLSPKQYRSLPPGEVIAFHRIENKGKVTYSVLRSVEDPDSKDIDTQLLTTVSTLVVAVAGFYFGSRSAQEGAGAALDAASPNRVLTVVKPISPFTLKDRDESVEGIRLQSVPADAQLRWSIDGDRGGRLARLQDGKFVYTPGKGPVVGNCVTLHFEQVDDPKVSDALIVNLPAESASGRREADRTPPKKRGLKGRLFGR